jgi:hypothetical protein
MKLDAGKKILIPVPVSTGDTIQVSAVDGATNDSTLVWFCQDGLYFIAGECTGIPIYVPGDPVPGFPHMGITIDVGAGPVGLGTSLFTVPSGVSNIQPTLDLNFDHTSDANGFFTFLVTVCNNQAETFNHVFNFPVNSGAWSLTPLSWGTNGEYLPSQGWHGTCNGAVDKYNQLVIQSIPVPHGQTFTDVGIAFSETVGPNAHTLTSLFLAHLASGGDTTLISRLSDDTTTPLAWHGSITNVDYFWIIWSCGIDPGGSCPVAGDILVPQILISGQGSDPF